MHTSSSTKENYYVLVQEQILQLFYLEEASIYSLTVPVACILLYPF